MTWKSELFFLISEDSPTNSVGNNSTQCEVVLCRSTMIKKLNLDMVIFCIKSLILWNFTGAWSGNDALTNCNKVEHDKILEFIGKLTKERKNFENLWTSVEVSC